MVTEKKSDAGKTTEQTKPGTSKDAAAGKDQSADKKPNEKTTTIPDNEDLVSLIVTCSF